jgi:hypothetical protein
VNTRVLSSLYTRVKWEEQGSKSALGTYCKSQPNVHGVQGTLHRRRCRRFQDPVRLGRKQVVLAVNEMTGDMVYYLDPGMSAILPETRWFT